MRDGQVSRTDVVAISAGASTSIHVTVADGTIRMVGYVQASVGSSAQSTMPLTMHSGLADGLLLVFGPYGSY